MAFCVKFSINEWDFEPGREFIGSSRSKDWAVILIGGITPIHSISATGSQPSVMSP